MSDYTPGPTLREVAAWEAAGYRLTTIGFPGSTYSGHGARRRIDKSPLEVIAQAQQPDREEWTNHFIGAYLPAGVTALWLIGEAGHGWLQRLCVKHGSAFADRPSGCGFRTPRYPSTFRQLQGPQLPATYFQPGGRGVEIPGELRESWSLFNLTTAGRSELAPGVVVLGTGQLVPIPCSAVLNYADGVSGPIKWWSEPLYRPTETDRFSIRSNVGSVSRRNWQTHDTVHKTTLYSPPKPSEWLAQLLSPSPAAVEESKHEAVKAKRVGK